MADPATLVPAASPLEPALLSLACFLAGGLFFLLPADLPALASQQPALLANPALLAPSALTYHLAYNAPLWHGYAGLAAFLGLVAAFLADFWRYRGGFRTIADVACLVALGVVVKQYLD